MLRISLALAAFAFGALGFLVSLSGCPANVNGGEGESGGEGEGAAAGEGEGEGVGGEGEGEGVGGEGEGEGNSQCPPPAPTCTTAPTSSLQLNAATASSEASLVADNGAPIVVGSTRATVEGAIGQGVKDQNNAFHVDYCSGGFQIQYVDGDGVFDQASSAGAATDVVARIVTLAGATVAVPNVTSDVTYTAGADAVDIASAQGIEQVLDATDAIVTAVAFKKQPSAAPFTATFVATANGQSISGLQVGQATFANVKTTLGAAFDADGQSQISTPFGNITIRTLIYASTGIRVAGLCSGTDCSDGSVTLNTIVLSPPFGGKDANNLTLGSAESDFDAANLGAKSGPDANGVTIYGTTGIGNSPTGVVYVQDSTSAACTERAAAIILGYTTQ
jgi:hypothetical protein